MHLAVSNNIQLLEKLIVNASKTDINIQNHDGQIPMHLAANTTSNVVELLKRKSSISVRDKKESFHLHMQLKMTKVKIL